MKRYYCDVCDVAVPNECNRNKIKITECWDGTTYKILLCDECLQKVFDLLKGVNNE